MKPWIYKHHGEWYLIYWDTTKGKRIYQFRSESDARMFLCHAYSKNWVKR